MQFSVYQLISQSADDGDRALLVCVDSYLTVINSDFEIIPRYSISIFAKGESYSMHLRERLS